jgi:hypothetical protein
MVKLTCIIFSTSLINTVPEWGTFCIHLYMYIRLETIGYFYHQWIIGDSKSHGIHGYVATAGLFRWIQSPNQRRRSGQASWLA